MEDEDRSLLGYNTTRSGRRVANIRRILLPPTSGLIPRHTCARYNTNVTMYINKKHTLRYNYSNVLIYVNFYMFRASLPHHQGVHNYINNHQTLSPSPKYGIVEVHQHMIYRDGYVHRELE